MWIFLLFALCDLFAAPIGNPAAPSQLEEGMFIPDTSWTNPQIAFTQDFLLQKQLRPSRTSPFQPAYQSALSGSAELVQLIWNIRERFNALISVGPAIFSWSWVQPNGRMEGQSDTGAFGSLGGSLVLLEVKDTSLAAQGQCGGWIWSRATLTFNGQPIAQKADNYFYYWQAGAALTQKIGPFSPYLGAMVNQTIFRAVHLPSQPIRLRSLILVGPFAGCSIGTQIASLNFEWRGWFEEGFSISAQLRF